MGFPSGGGTTHFYAEFTLDQGADFTLDASGTLTGFGFGATDGLPGGIMFMTHPPSTVHGFMRAGTYQLLDEASGSAGSPASGNGFAVSLTIPSSGAAALLGLGSVGFVIRRRR